MSSSFEDFLRTIIREETEVICQKTQAETIKILEAKTDQIVREIGRLYNETSVISSEPKEQYKYKSTTDSNNSTIMHNANAMAKYSNFFKSMPDLSSSDEYGQGRPYTAPRYKKTADGIRAPPIDRQTSIKKKIAVQKSYSKPCLAIRRECMSQALQANIVPIVEGLEFTRSSLPEQLIAAGHMTEEECNAIRTDIKTRKDQIRYVVSRTKSRSLQDMEEFLGLINQQIPHVVTKIREQFESNLKRNDTSLKCKLCLCYENVDVKEVVDILWSIGAVPDGFYRNAINCSKPRGCQEHLWQKLIDICNNKQTAEKQKAFGMLFEYIRNIGARGTFNFIVTDLKSMLEVEKKLLCHCQSSLSFKVRLSERDSNDSNRISSCYSPRSSASDDRRSTLSDELCKETDIDDESHSKASGAATARKFIRQSSLNEDMTEDTIPKQKIYQSKSMETLDTITEDTSMAFKKDRIVHQTLEFHRPLRVQVDFEGTRRNRNTYGANSNAHRFSPNASEMRSRRYGSIIRNDDIDDFLSRNSFVT